MKLVTIVGPLRDYNSIVLNCIAECGFHPDSPAPLVKMIKGLRPLDLSDTYQDKLQRIEHLLECLDIDPVQTSTAISDEVLSDLRLTELETRVDALIAQREELTELMAEDEQLVSQLALLHDIDIPIEQLYNVVYLKFRFGRLPRDIYNHFYPVIKDFPDVYFFATDIQRDYVYGMYMVPHGKAEMIDALISSLQFQRIRISDKLHGSSDEAVKAARADLEVHSMRINEISEELGDIAGDERSAIIAAFYHYRRLAAAFELKRYTVCCDANFYLNGWIPEEKFDSFESSIRAWDNVSILPVEHKGPSEDFVPPTRLRNNAFFRPFESFVTMYGLPSYNEIDPTPLVALTYSLLFGAMFGDLGHAFLLMLAGLFMWKRKGMWLGKILCRCAAGSALFGAFYGSIFGYEDLLPGFKAAHSSETIFITLRVSIYVGAVLLALTIILNILNGVRQRDWNKILFGPASLTGLVLYTGITLTVLPFIGFGTSMLPTGVLMLLIIIPTIVIFFGSPLKRLINRESFMVEESLGSFVLTGLFELFEEYLSFITNTISFLRVGAYAISHAALMMAVYSLARLPNGSYNIVVIIIGNLLVAGLEAALVAIQVLRLQYYELFGRFFSGEGKPYKSISLDK